MRELLAKPGVIGIAEMMNFPAVIAGDEGELAKLALAPGGNVDGHAPGVLGAQLDAYLAAGIRTDHETTTWEEALERRRRGAWVLIREASNARNLEALLELVRRHGPERCAFCTDDREPDMLLREGHLDQMCRVAVAHGIAAEDALLMASLHPALCHGLTDRGAIAPGLPRRPRAARGPRALRAGARGQGRRGGGGRPPARRSPCRTGCARP